MQSDDGSNAPEAVVVDDSDEMVIVDDEDDNDDERDDAGYIFHVVHNRIEQQQHHRRRQGPAIAGGGDASQAATTPVQQQQPLSTMTMAPVHLVVYLYVATAATLPRHITTLEFPLLNVDSITYAMREGQVFFYIPCCHGDTRKLKWNALTVWTMCADCIPDQHSHLHWRRVHAIHHPYETSGHSTAAATTASRQQQQQQQQ